MAASWLPVGCAVGCWVVRVLTGAPMEMGREENAVSVSDQAGATRSCATLVCSTGFSVARFQASGSMAAGKEMASEVGLAMGSSARTPRRAVCRCFRVRRLARYRGVEWEDQRRSRPSNVDHAISLHPTLAQFPVWARIFPAANQRLGALSTWGLHIFIYASVWTEDRAKDAKNQ